MEEADGDKQAKEALDLYGVLEADDWLARLANAYYTADQKEQLRETVYVTLVSLADWCVRYGKHGPKVVERGLDLLRRAEALHQPTRAFYFVRSEYHRRHGDKAAADEDEKRFRASAARTAWDYYLPGHTAGWNGDLQEAIRSYRAALYLQPDHFTSLYFLADRLAKINRFPEAIQLYSACIAVNPHFSLVYLYRGKCYEKLGQIDDAAEAYGAAVRFFSDGFAAKPELATSLTRYHAACAAALASNLNLEDKECARFRGQALALLRDGLAAYRSMLATAPVQVWQGMKMWQKDPDFTGIWVNGVRGGETLAKLAEAERRYAPFASVRGDEALAKLPEAERQEWRKLWEEVEELRQRAAEKR